jgi:DNA-binding NarL/FixJ family response regulator
MKVYVPPDDNLRKSSQRCFAVDQIKDIKELRENGWTYKQIGDKFFCSRETVRRYCVKY